MALWHRVLGGQTSSVLELLTRQSCQWRCSGTPKTHTLWISNTLHDAMAYLKCQSWFEWLPSDGNPTGRRSIKGMWCARADLLRPVTAFSIDRKRCVFLLSSIWRHRSSTTGYGHKLDKSYNIFVAWGNLRALGEGPLYLVRGEEVFKWLWSHHDGFREKSGYHFIDPLDTIENQNLKYNLQIKSKRWRRWKSRKN